MSHKSTDNPARKAVCEAAAASPPPPEKPERFDELTHLRLKLAAAKTGEARNAVLALRNQFAAGQAQAQLAQAQLPAAEADLARLEQEGSALFKKTWEEHGMGPDDTADDDGTIRRVAPPTKKE